MPAMTEPEPAAAAPEAEPEAEPERDPGQEAAERKAAEEAAAKEKAEKEAKEKEEKEQAEKAKAEAAEREKEAKERAAAAVLLPSTEHVEWDHSKHGKGTKVIWRKDGRCGTVAEVSAKRGLIRIVSDDARLDDEDDSLPPSGFVEAWNVWVRHGVAAAPVGEESEPEPEERYIASSVQDAIAEAKLREHEQQMNK